MITADTSNLRRLVARKAALAGRPAQAEALANSHISRVIAVACNPATFARDARLLSDGGFRLARPNDHLLVTDFATVEQQTTSVTVEFDDDSVADFYDEQVDLGREPNCFSRIWLHTV